MSVLISATRARSRSPSAAEDDANAVGALWESAAESVCGSGNSAQVPQTSRKATALALTNSTAINLASCAS